MIRFYQIALLLSVTIAVADYIKNRNPEREKTIQKITMDMSAEELGRYDFERMKKVYRVWMSCLIVSVAVALVIIILKIIPQPFFLFFLLFELIWKGVMKSQRFVKFICRKRK